MPMPILMAQEMLVLQLSKSSAMRISQENLPAKSWSSQAALTELVSKQHEPYQQQEQLLY